MMLMVHYSPSITSLASQHPKNHTFSLPSFFFALPHQARGSPSHWPLCDHPPTPPNIHFVRPSQLQPSLSAGFRDFSKFALCIVVKTKALAIRPRHWQVTPRRHVRKRAGNLVSRSAFRTLCLFLYLCRGSYAFACLFFLSVDVGCIFTFRSACEGFFCRKGLRYRPALLNYI